MQALPFKLSRNGLARTVHHIRLGEGLQRIAPGRRERKAAVKAFQGDSQYHLLGGNPNAFQV